MTDGRPKTDPPTEAHDSNQLGGEEPAFYAAAAALDNLDTDLSDHAGSTSGVHGVGASNVESESGAQSKADSAESSAKSYTDDHENKSNPHSGSASDTDLSNHVNDGTNPHGVTAAQTGALDAADYNPEADTHSRPAGTQTGGKVGGIVETAGPKTKSVGNNTLATFNFQLDGQVSDETFAYVSQDHNNDGTAERGVLARTPRPDHQ